MRFYTLLIALAFINQGFSQQTTELKTIENQFNTLYRKSSSYQVYKVISKEKYKHLQKNVSDSIHTLNRAITQANNLIKNQKSVIISLEKKSQETNIKLSNAINNENSISLFGISMTKQWYAFILFSVIFILIGLLLYFVFKFSNSNVHTTKAKNDLEDVENEFAIFRKKAIEREQKIRRELQDVIIKNRNN